MLPYPRVDSLLARRQRGARMARISSRLAEDNKTDKGSAFRTARFRSDAARASNAN
jgi:hypothetical protein